MPSSSYDNVSSTLSMWEPGHPKKERINLGLELLSLSTSLFPMILHMLGQEGIILQEENHPFSEVAIRGWSNRSSIFNYIIYSLLNSKKNTFQGGYISQLVYSLRKTKITFTLYDTACQIFTWSRYLCEIKDSIYEVTCIMKPIVATQEEVTMSYFQGLLFFRMILTIHVATKSVENDRALIKEGMK